MFAVVRTGGKQYRVSPEDRITVEKLDGDEGSTVTLDDVLLVSDDGTIRAGAKVAVKAEIVAQNRAKKITVFKKRRRQNYRRKQGHRQYQTVLKILSIA